MKVNLIDKVIYRVPQFPVGVSLNQYWPALKESIRNASSYFYGIIKDLEAGDILFQSEAVQITIAKYFNRARYRATPFGSFGSIGLTSLTDGGNCAIEVLSDRGEVVYQDWKKTRATIHQWKENDIHSLKFLANDSWYIVGSLIRYICQQDSEFEICEIPYYTEVENILKTCKTITTFDHLFEELKKDGFTTDELQGIIMELIECGILMQQFSPNIIGQDYFTRIGAAPEPGAEEYIISTCTTVSGGMGKEQFADLRSLLDLLSRQKAKVRTGDLDRFISAFKNRYDKQEVPLMLALDPFTGIGYGNLENYTAGSIIGDLLTEEKAEDPADTVADKMRKSLLKDAIFGKSVIDLETLLSREPEKESLPFPNTFSALVSIQDELLVLEQLGGTTANLLAGRFSLGNKEVLGFCKDIVNIEQEANPDVLFFDIAYSGESDIDNVNRREQIYDYQVNILNFIDLPGTIHLQDIFIKIIGEELILFSKSLKKRLVPRLASSYSYSRSQLALFRLLCDVQTQNINFSPLPDLAELFNGLDYIPRIQYRNIICSTAKWLINRKEAAKTFTEFRNFLNSLHLSQYIKIGEADQTLLLDSTKDQDLRLLHSILKVRRALWIQESFSPFKTTVCDEQGNKYLSEYVVSFYHKERLYQPFHAMNNSTEVKRIYPVGDTWLCYELFCHPQNSEVLLYDYIRPFLHQNQAIIKQWFFVRYNEDGDHIRLRIKLSEKEKFGYFLQFFSEKVLCPTYSVILNNARMCSYSRELERYGADNIYTVEALFHEDARYILYNLDQNTDESRRIQVAFKLLHEVANSIFEPETVFELVRELAALHNLEHKVNHYVFKKINKVFKENTHLWKDTDILPELQRLADMYIGFLNTINDLSCRKQLFADLMHMHVNRIFVARQREQEMLLYNLIECILKQVKAKQKQRETTCKL